MSPHDVLGLSGNVAELLLDCSEELDAVYGTDALPLIRPDGRSSTACVDAVLVGGASWRSMGFVETGALTFYVMRNGDRGIEYVDAAAEPDLRPYVRDYERDRLWGETEAGPGEPEDGPGNERRSWWIGFRCAYELPEE